MGSAWTGAWIRLLSFQLVHVIVVVAHVDNINHVGNEGDLPTTSSDFIAAFSCNREGQERHSNKNSFYQRVQSGRHTTWTPGWEVAIPRFNNSNVNVTKEDHDPKTYYARVFDLLNWSREHNLQPVPIHISTICHKGMELQIDASGIESEEDSTLGACTSKLQDKGRASSMNCIDMPGLLVANPNPPFKVNNPCHLEYRMIDGAHRLCLRKYLLTLLKKELRELEEEYAADEMTSKLLNKIEQKRNLINETSHGLFFVTDQTTFQSMLINSDPYTTWAKSKEQLMKDFSDEMQLEWDQWMSRVMDHVFEWKFEQRDEGKCINFEAINTDPREEL